MFKLTVITAFAAALFPFAHAAEESCISVKQEYQKEFKATLECLEKQPSCAKEVSRMIQKAKGINACAPDVPKNQGTGGGYSVKNLGIIRSGCDTETKKLQSVPLYDCLAKWNHAAKQQYKFPLPKDDCSSLVDPFIAARNALYACMAAKYPGVDPVMKVEF